MKRKKTPVWSSLDGMTASLRQQKEKRCGEETQSELRRSKISVNRCRVKPCEK
jgi:hypothetical protein